MTESTITQSASGKPTPAPTPMGTEMGRHLTVEMHTPTRQLDDVAAAPEDVVVEVLAICEIVPLVQS